MQQHAPANKRAKSSNRNSSSAISSLKLYRSLILPARHPASVGLMYHDTDTSSHSSIQSFSLMSATSPGAQKISLIREAGKVTGCDKLHLFSNVFHHCWAQTYLQIKMRRFSDRCRSPSCTILHRLTSTVSATETAVSLMLGISPNTSQTHKALAALTRTRCLTCLLLPN